MNLKLVSAISFSLLVSSYAFSSEYSPEHSKIESDNQFEKNTNQLQLIIEKRQQLKDKKQNADKLISLYLNQPINVFIYKVDFKKFPNDITHFNDIINKNGNVYNALSKEGDIVDGNIISFPLTIYYPLSPNNYSIVNQKKYVYSSKKDSDGKIHNEYRTTFGGIDFSAYLNNVSDEKLSIKLSIKRRDLNIFPSSVSNNIEVPQITENSISTDVVINKNRFTVVSVANQLEGNKNIFEFIVIEANPK